MVNLHAAVYEAKLSGYHIPVKEKMQLTLSVASARIDNLLFHLRCDGASSETLSVMPEGKPQCGVSAQVQSQDGSSVTIQITQEGAEHTAQLMSIALNANIPGQEIRLIITSIQPTALSRTEFPEIETYINAIISQYQNGRLFQAEAAEDLALFVHLLNNANYPKCDPVSGYMDFQTRVPETYAKLASCIQRPKSSNRYLDNIQGVLQTTENKRRYFQTIDSQKQLALEGHKGVEPDYHLGAIAKRVFQEKTDEFKLTLSGSEASARLDQLLDERFFFQAQSNYENYLPGLQLWSARVGYQHPLWKAHILASTWMPMVSLGIHSTGNSTFLIQNFYDIDASILRFLTLQYPFATAKLEAFSVQYLQFPSYVKANLLEVSPVRFSVYGLVTTDRVQESNFHWRFWGEWYTMQSLNLFGKYIPQEKKGMYYFGEADVRLGFFSYCIAQNCARTGVVGYYTYDEREISVFNRVAGAGAGIKIFFSKQYFQNFQAFFDVIPVMYSLKEPSAYTYPPGYTWLQSHVRIGVKFWKHI